MKKHLISVLAIILIIAQTTHGQYTLTNTDVSVSEGKIVSYSYSGGGTEPTDIIIPSTLHGQAITTIGVEAFENLGLTSVELPSSILTIEDRAFAQNLLTALIIPEGTVRINRQAFIENTITNLTLPGTLVHIGLRAFNNNNISILAGVASNGLVFRRNPDGTEDNTGIVSYGGSSTTINFIPGTVHYIEKQAFQESSLTEVIIPATVDSIMNSAFSDNAIETLTLPSNLLFLDVAAFSRNSITQINSSPSDGLVYGRKPDGSEDITIINSYGGSSTSIDFIPEGVKTIAARAFFNCNIASLTLPSTTERIEASAFSNNSISSLSIPEGVDSLFQFSFYNNNISSLSLPVTLKYIDRFAFSYNSLTSLSLPTNLSHIGDRAFSNNNITGTLEIPGSVKYVGEGCFNDNDISEVVLNYGTEHLGDWAFGSMPGHTVPNIPNSLIYIGGGTMSNSFNLPCPYRENYTVSWNNGEYACGDWVVDYVSYIASFSPFEYTITYDLDGGSTDNPDTYSHEDTITFKAAEKPGYPFEGWFSNAAFTGEQVVKFDEGTKGDTTLYAKWGDIIVYSITYHLDGGTNGANPSSYNVESSFTLEDPDHTEAVFTGWYDNPEYNGEPISAIEMGSTGDLDLYAKWYSAYEVTFTAGENGNLVGNLYQVIQKGENCSQIIAVADDGYQLRKWVGITGDSLGIMNPLAVANVQHDSSLTAVFEKISFAEIIYDTVKVHDTAWTVLRDTILVIDTNRVTVFDTNMVTVYDSVAVTDTLIINAVLAGISPPDNINRIKVYPNPAHEYLYIETGNYLKMSGYRIRIANQLGQPVFDKVIVDPLYVINLSSWTGKGLYVIQVIDPGGIPIEQRKIILE